MILIKNMVIIDNAAKSDDDDDDDDDADDDESVSLLLLLLMRMMVMTHYEVEPMIRDFRLPVENLKGLGRTSATMRVFKFFCGVLGVFGASERDTHFRKPPELQRRRALNLKAPNRQYRGNLTLTPQFPTV